MSGTVTPISTATSTAAKAIKVGDEPLCHRYHAGRQDRLRRQLRRGDRHADQHRDQHRRQADQHGSHPRAIAITPDGRTAYVANSGAENVPHSATVTPIRVATGTAGKPIGLAGPPQAIAITPNGKTAYVSTGPVNTVVPISTATNTAGKPISIGDYAQAITITPDGRTAYVNEIQPQGVFLVPIRTATNTPGKPIKAGSPQPVAITPDSRTVYAPTLPDWSFP